MHCGIKGYATIWFRMSPTVCERLNLTTILEHSKIRQGSYLQQESSSAMPFQNPSAEPTFFSPTSEGNSHMLQNNLFLQGGGGENRSLWQKAYSYFADKTNEFEQTRIQHSPWFDLHGWEVAKNYDQSLLMCILAYINYYTQRDDTQWNNVCQYCIFPTLNVVPVQLRFVCVCVCV